MIDPFHSRERLRTVIVPDHDDLAVLIADRMVQAIRREVGAKGRCVLGLATGSTPLGLYRELIARHRKGEVSFAQVVTFNLDEYYPMAAESPQSYRRYMWETFFHHVDIKPANVHIPDGTILRDALEAHCQAYERDVAAAGGIDFQLPAAGALTRVATPWLLGPVEWTPEATERAVVWLAQTVKQAILKLSAPDYADHHLSSLLARYGTPGPLNGEIFNRLREKIRGRARLMKGKRVLVFSPHPDDDVISMGG